MSDWQFKDDAVYLPWPAGENGKPAKEVFLERIENQLDLEMELTLLQAYSIPTIIRRPDIKIFMGYSPKGADIFVPETMLEDAMNIISINPSAMDMDAYRTIFDDDEFLPYDDEDTFDNEEDSDQ